MKSRQLIILAATGLVNSKAQAYKILGLPETASKEDINKAFKTKAKLIHPDVNPSVDPVEMKLLIAARDFLLANKDIYEPTVIEEEYENPPDLSYEEIADLRKEIGRNEFNKRYPGWEGELKHEIGLNRWNLIFENYDPAEYYEDHDDDRAWEIIQEEAEITADEIFEKAKSDKAIDFYTNFDDLISKYPELAKPSPWVVRHGFEKEFLIKVKKEIEKKFFNNLDNFDISFQDVLDFPNDQVLASFLEREGNVDKYTFPNPMLETKDFGRSIILILYDNFEVGAKVINKYRNNKFFLAGLFESVNYMNALKYNEKAVNLIKSLPFTPEEMKVVDRWLKLK